MIVPRKRFILLLGAGFVPALFALFNPAAPAVLAAYWACLLAAAAYDAATAPRRAELIPTRRHEKFLSIGRENAVRIAVENRSGRSVSLEIRDLYPDEFIVGDDTLTLELEPLSAAEAGYGVTPVRKGEFRFTALHLRAAGRLGLMARQYRYELESAARVYPDIIELKKYLRMTTLNRIEQLGYRKREPGGESEFDFLREYRQGDDYKRIHWKATAKKRVPVTRVYEKEYNRNVLSLLDAGRMMTTRYGALSKLDYAVNASLILAAAAKNRKDLFGLTVFTDRIVSHVPPKRDTRLFTGILPALCAAEPLFVRSDYLSAYRFLRDRAAKNSIIFVFSEIYNRVISADLIAMLEMLSRRHAVNMVSFEEREDEPGRSYAGIARWALQREQSLERELIIRELSLRGVHTIRVTSRDITKQVVNSYLAS